MYFLWTMQKNHTQRTTNKKIPETCRSRRSDTEPGSVFESITRGGLCHHLRLTCPILPQCHAQLSPRHAMDTTTWKEAQASPWARCSCTGARRDTSWWAARGSPASARRALRPGATPHPSARVRSPRARPGPCAHSQGLSGSRGQRHTLSDSGWDVQPPGLPHSDQASEGSSRWGDPATPNRDSEGPA